MSGLRLGPSARRLVRDRRGGVAVEFAFVATILITSLAGVVDLMQISSLNREIERSSTQIAAILTSCEGNADGSCITNTMNAYKDRRANTLVRMQSATVSFAQIAEISGALRVCAGPMTYLDTDVAASALAILNDQDTGIVVLIQTQYNALIPFITQAFTGTRTPQLRGWTVAVQRSKNPCLT